VVICEALLAYLATPDLNVAAYWARLAKDGITKERLQSYDRAIRSEPNFPQDKRASLTKALTEYLRTLKAVHSGADLASAADAVLGYRQASSQGVAIHNPPLPGVATPHLRQLLHTAQAAAGVAAAAAASGDDAKRRVGSSLSCTEALVLACEAIVEARHELRPWTKAGGAAVPDGRDADVLYLDQGLETALRTACEACLSVLTTRPASDVITVTGLALENLALSAGSNSELVLCLKEWRAIEAAARGDAADKAAKGAALWPLRAKAAADRLRLALSSQSERATLALAAPAASLGSRLGVPPHTVALFPEEVVRGTSAAPVAQLLRVLEPRLRELANLGAWQVISPVQAAGTVVCVPTLGEVAAKTFEQPTVLIASHVSGDEDIAGGVVAVFTPDAPDVLSHVSVRARNEGVLFATVYDSAVFEGLKAMAGNHVACTPSPDGSNVAVTRAEAPTKQQQQNELQGGKKQGGSVARIVQRPFKGTYAVPSVAFTHETVGGKSRNLNGLRRVQLPAGVRLPAGAALAFGSFDQALNDGCNSAVRADFTKRLAELKRLRPDEAGHDEVLASIRGVVARMTAPKQLRASLKEALAAEGIPVPGEAGGTGTWEEAWSAITTVWASKWNSRAVTACAKAGLAHSDIAMAVLVQEHVPARLSFVLHTTNPVNGKSDEVYGELVVGLGDTLVGASPGRALSFSVPKGDGTAAGVGQPQLLGFPSKPLGLFNPVRTLIFRSDSNGEDLEGYAGAGLYDSVAMHLPQEAAVDYASEQVMCDAAFRTALLQRIAQAGVVAEQALGGPQDIEGCVTADAEVIIVQTRPQV
jgi:alpha-glucan,water dikinase